MENRRLSPVSRPGIREKILAEHRFGEVYHLAAAIVQIGFIVFKQALTEIQGEICCRNIFQQHTGAVSGEDIAGKSGVAGRNIGGVVVKADVIVCKGAVRGIGPHIAEYQKGRGGSGAPCR